MFRAVNIKRRGCFWQQGNMSILDEQIKLLEWKDLVDERGNLVVVE